MDICALDMTICCGINDLHVSIEEVCYLMAIDADTCAHKESITQMVCSMEYDDNIFALCTVWGNSGGQQGPELGEYDPSL